MSLSFLQRFFQRLFQVLFQGTGRSAVPRASAPRSIVVVRLSALGDVLLVVPTVRRLQQQFPNCRITWITQRAFLPLLTSLENVEVFGVEKPKKLADYLTFFKQFRGRRFDVLLAMQASLRINLLYPLIRADQKIGYDRARAKDLQRFFSNRQIEAAPEHLVDSFLRFANLLTRDVQSVSCEPSAVDLTVEWRLTVPENDQLWVRDRLIAPGLWVALNPAASKPERTCLPAFYAGVITRIVCDFHAQVVLTGGGSAWERGLAASVLSLLSPAVSLRVLNWVGQTTLTQLAAVLQRVDVLIAPDTGPVHLATALATPVVGLYAVARPELSGPYHAEQGVVNAYPQAVQHFLRRSVDDVAWGQRVHDRDAMALITEEAVLTALRNVLSVPALSVTK